MPWPAQQPAPVTFTGWSSRRLDRLANARLRSRPFRQGSPADPGRPGRAPPNPPSFVRPQITDLFELRGRVSADASRAFSGGAEFKPDNAYGSMLESLCPSTPLNHSEAPSRVSSCRCK